MKVLIELKPLTNKFLGHNYYYPLSSSIYNRLKDSGIVELHDGAPSNWTFHLDLSKCLPTKRGFKITDNVCLIVSSSDERIINHLDQSFKSDMLFKIGSCIFCYVQSRIADDILSGEVFMFKTLSPINVAWKEKGGKEIVLDPCDKRFTTQLKKNMLLKASDDVGDVSIEVVPNSVERKMITLKGAAKQICYHLIFFATGDREVIQSSFSKGFGKRTGQGFGMVELLRQDSI